MRQAARLLVPRTRHGLDALTLNKPEIFIGNCASKFDETTGELKDETTLNLIKQQLDAFARFIERHGGEQQVSGGLDGDGEKERHQ